MTAMLKDYNVFIIVCKFSVIFSINVHVKIHHTCLSVFDRLCGKEIVMSYYGMVSYRETNLLFLISRGVKESLILELGVNLSYTWTKCVGPECYSWLWLFDSYDGSQLLFWHLTRIYVKEQRFLADYGYWLYMTMVS